MYRRASTLSFLLTCCVLSGCATVGHTRVPPGGDENETGIRYYNPSPYLLVHSDGKGGILTQLLYLPDPGKKMSARPSTFLADVSATMNFDRGVLTAAVETGDATTVSAAVMKAVETLGPAFLGVLNETKPRAELSVPAPHLYKIVVKGDSVTFLGGEGDKGFTVTLLPPAKEK